MQIRDVMTSHVSMVKPETAVSEIAVKMRDEDIGSVPVTDGDKLIGIVTDRDIVTRGLAQSPDMSRVKAKDVMSPKILYCMEDESVTEVLENMREEQVRRLPVVNREKRLVGVVSLGDLSKAETQHAGDALAGISKTAQKH